MEPKENLTWGIVIWKLIKGALYLTWSFVTGLYRAWALTVIWGWFLVGFMGLPVLPMWIAIGLSLTVGFLTFSTADIYTSLMAQEKLPAGTEMFMTWLASPMITTLFLIGGWIWTVLRPFVGI